MDLPNISLCPCTFVVPGCHISLSSLDALLFLSVLQREAQVGGRGPGHLGHADEVGGAQHIYPLLASSGRAQLGQTVCVLLRNLLPRTLPLRSLVRAGPSATPGAGHAAAGAERGRATASPSFDPSSTAAQRTSTSGAGHQMCASG